MVPSVQLLSGRKPLQNPASLRSEFSGPSYQVPTYVWFCRILIDLNDPFSKVWLNWVQWYMPLISGLGKQRQTRLSEFQASLVAIGSSRPAGAIQWGSCIKLKKGWQLPFSEHSHSLICTNYSKENKWNKYALQIILFHGRTSPMFTDYPYIF